MGKLQVIKTMVQGKLGRTGLVINKYSPEILMGVGIVGVITSTVMVCKATTKADVVLDKLKSDKEKIIYAKENLSHDYTEQDYKKDLTISYVQAGVGFVKLYGPSITLAAVSIGCILGSHGIMKKRNLALVAAYKAVEQSFADYRKRVVAEYGSEKDRLFKNGIVQSEISVTETDENGKTKKVKAVIESVDPNGISQYARFFDEGSVNWSKTPEYNLVFLKCQQNYANDLLHARGHIFLNEVYDLIGVPRSQAGAVVGWVAGEGDDFVDFGIFDHESMAKRDFVNGYERSILLDFNVSGVIYDLI
jgi:hypothetical protein